MIWKESLISRRGRSLSSVGRVLVEEAHPELSALVDEGDAFLSCMRRDVKRRHTSWS